MEEINRLTKEQIFAAEAYFNLATMIGKCLQISVYQLDHPEYKPKFFATISGTNEPDQAEDNSSASFSPEASPLSSGRIKSNELGTENQIHQMLCLYDERIRKILGPSALYDMLHIASEVFSFDIKSADDELSPLDKEKAAVAWVIVKRAFAVNHPDEALHLLNLPDVIAGDIVYNTPPLARMIDDNDREFITASCSVCYDVVFNHIPLQQLIDESVRALEKEKKASQSLMLPPLGSVPNGDPLNWLYRVVSSKNGRLVDQRKGNRHESIKRQEQGGTIRFTRTNKQNGNTVIVEIAQAEKYLSKTSKTFTKTLLFTLQKMNDQNFPLEVGFPLQELVELGMYSTTSNAARAMKEFFSQQKQIMLSGKVKKGRNTIKEEGGVLFYHYRIENGYVKLSVNENFNMEFIANYFTVFPRFAYALSNNAFNLVRYIFSLARQNASKIKNNGTFTIGLDSVRENLGLPAPEEVKNSRYKQLIIEPIEAAIDEIEEAAKTVPEAQNYGFTITPIGTNTTNINQWLSGYLEIGLKGDFADTFIKLAKKAEADRTKWERIKMAELAKLAAKKELEATKNEPKKD